MTALPEETLKELYEKMAAHTLPECASCRRPHSCCSNEYCEAATDFAASHGVRLEKVRSTALLYMSDTGCVVHPMYRPLCTLHTCSINSLGYKPGDEAWTDEYFRLRDKINEIEFVFLDNPQFVLREPNEQAVREMKEAFEQKRIAVNEAAGAYVLTDEHKAALDIQISNSEKHDRLIDHRDRMIKFGEKY